MFYNTVKQQERSLRRSLYQWGDKLIQGAHLHFEQSRGANAETKKLRKDVAEWDQLIGEMTVGMQILKI
ncbi:MAG: hypothetical protein OXG88_01345 [Gammaproteobacteria bacterium]|nr:hypothetical protein [Gammaproteobacteria bacterium]